MAAETILVIDAGQDLEEKITTVLEAEGYLIYPVSSQGVNAEMAALLKPSLIYIKPPDLRPAGLDPCKAIHSIPLLMKVPIVILASLKKAPGSQYLEEYGIVDFLEPTFSKEELIEKTGTILVKKLFSEPPQREEPAVLRTIMGTERKRSPLFLVAVGVVVLGIAGAAYVAYQQLIPNQKVVPSRGVTGTIRLSSTTPGAESKREVPPANTPSKTPASTPVDTPAASTPAKGAVNTPADPPVPASSVSSTPPAQSSTAAPGNVSQPTPKPFYSVQLGAFREERQAHALTKKFQEKGYDAFTQPGVTKDKSRIYRVLVNKYEDRKAAQKMAGEIQTKEQVKTTLYSER